MPRAGRGRKLLHSHISCPWVQFGSGRSAPSWPKSVPCPVGPLWEGTHSPDLSESASVWLSDTKGAMCIASATHLRIHRAPLCAGSGGEQKAGLVPAPWSSLSQGEPGTGQTHRPVSDHNRGCKSRVEGAGLSGSGRGPIPLGRGLSRALQGRGRGNSMAASGNGRRKQVSWGLRRGQAGSSGGPWRRQKLEGPCRPKQSVVSIPRTKRGRWMVWAWLFCLRCFGEWGI